MRRRRRSRNRDLSAAKRRLRPSWLRLPSKRVLTVVFATGGFVALCAAGVLGVGRLEGHVRRLLLDNRPDPVVEFIDLPKELYGLANQDLQQSLFEVLGRDWVEDRMCGEIAARMESVAWVSRVQYVRRTGGGRFEISCRYRMPVAIVRVDDDAYLVDEEAVRLPGLYIPHPAWRIIEGVAAGPPAPGQPWVGDDIRAAISVLTALRREPFGDQIVGVGVGNHGGRKDPRVAHIELLTDRPGGRIRWGSAPGRELEESGVQQKLALLRENFGKTGRADAHFPVIDISVYPDRFTVPG